MRDLILNLARKRHGLGRMWRYIRAMKQYQDQSDLGIFRLIIHTLKKNGYKVTNKSISYHFKNNVDPEDYENDRKVEKGVMKDLHGTGGIIEGQNRLREEFLMEMIS